MFAQNSQKPCFVAFINILFFRTPPGIDIYKRFTTIFPSKDALELKNIDEAFEYMKKAMRNFCNFVVEIHDKENMQLFLKLKTYVEANFKKPLSHEALAIQFKTTFSYLNKVFLENESKSIADYLNRLRINQAKKVMRETDIDDDFFGVSLRV